MPIANRGRHTLQKTFNRGTVIQLFFYSIVSIAGYVSFGPYTPAFYPDRPLPLGGKDWSKYIKLLNCIGMLFVFLIGMSVQTAPCRFQMTAILGKFGNKSSSHIFITAFILVVITIVSIMYPFIYTINSIIGGIFATLQGFTVPGLASMLLLHNPRKRVLAFVLVSIITFLGFYQSGIIILQQFQLI